MEQNTSELLEMHLDYDGGNVLRQAVRWSRFLAIVGMFGIGLLLLLVPFAGPQFITLYSTVLPGIEDFMGLILFVFVLILAIAGVLVFMLYRFSILTRRGIETQDQALFNRGLKGLKTYFLINGILALVSLLFNILSITSLF
jgi:hypothetical protein